MVITSKHHDGFCLFETEATDYNVMEATPFRRDIIKELSVECARQGLKFGVYYSQFRDWYHRSRGRNNPGTMSTEEYLDLVANNLDELLSNYGEMAVLRFDTGGNDVIEADQQGARVRELQPNAVICSRLYSRRVPAEQRKYADFSSLPDRMLPTQRMMEDTEACMTMRHNWGYDRNDDHWKSSKDILEFLVYQSEDETYRYSAKRQRWQTRIASSRHGKEQVYSAVITDGDKDVSTILDVLESEEQIRSPGRRGKPKSHPGRSIALYGEKT